MVTSVSTVNSSPNFSLCSEMLNSGFDVSLQIPIRVKTWFCNSHTAFQNINCEWKHADHTAFSRAAGRCRLGNIAFWVFVLLSNRVCSMSSCYNPMFSLIQSAGPYAVNFSQAWLLSGCCIKLPADSPTALQQTHLVNVRHCDTKSSCW